MQYWKVQLFSYLTAMWRYRWYAVAATWVVCLIGWVAVAVIPNQYKSEAKVYIDTETLMHPLMAGLAVNTNTDQQIDILIRTLITRPNVEQVLKLTDPEIARASPAVLQAKVDEVQNAITLRPLEAKNLYAIAYQNNDPAFAVAITQALVTLLVNSNLGDQRRDMQGVQSFIDEQIANYERQLRDIEKRRSDFKVKNMAYITGNAGATAAGLLDRAQAGVEEAQSQLDSAMTGRASLLTQLQTTTPLLQVDAAAPIIINAQVSNLQSELVQAQTKLDDLQTRYTDNHPDVISTKKLLERLKAQASAPPPPIVATPRPQQGISNPTYVALQNRLADAETNVALQRRKLELTKAAEEDVKKKMSEAISVEREYTDLDRDYEVMHKNYLDLVSRREVARLSQAMGDQQSTVAFRIVEPPLKPANPAAPNRPILNAIVLLFGVSIGASAAFLLTLNAERFIVSDQLLSAFNVPIIGVVSRIRRAADIVQLRKSVVAVGASFGVLALCFVLIQVFIEMNLLPKLSNLI